MDELDLIWRLRNPYIVCVLGHFWNPDSDTLCIVTELMDGGSLQSVLRNPENVRVISA